MKVLSGKLNKQLHKVFSTVDNLFLLGNRSHLSENFFIVLRTPHVGHFTSIEYIVQVFQERFFDDLGIRE